MSAAASRVATVADARLVLPEHWWTIPLHPPGARERSVTALADRQLAGTDRPELRADLHARLLTQAEQAAASDGRLLALSLLRVGDVPVPASLVLHLLDLPGDPDAVPGDGSLLLAVQDELRPPAGSGTSLDLSGTVAGTVLRRVHEQPAELVGAEPVSCLVADYWLERPDGTGLVQLAFATPMLVWREPMLELFDTIVSPVRWTEP